MRGETVGANGTVAHPVHPIIDAVNLEEWLYWIYVVRAVRSKSRQHNTTASNNNAAANRYSSQHKPSSTNVSSTTTSFTPTHEHKPRPSLPGKRVARKTGKWITSNVFIVWAVLSVAQTVIHYITAFLGDPNVEQQSIRLYLTEGFFNTATAQWNKATSIGGDGAAHPRTQLRRYAPATHRAHRTALLPLGPTDVASAAAVKALASPTSFTSPSTDAHPYSPFGGDDGEAARRRIIMSKHSEQHRTLIDLLRERGTISYAERLPEDDIFDDQAEAEAYGVGDYHATTTGSKGRSTDTAQLEETYHHDARRGGVHDEDDEAFATALGEPLYLQAQLPAGVEPVYGARETTERVPVSNDLLPHVLQNFDSPAAGFSRLSVPPKNVVINVSRDVEIDRDEGDSRIGLEKIRLEESHSPSHDSKPEGASYMRRPSETALQVLVESCQPQDALRKSLKDALRYAVNRCDLRLLEWLVAVPDPSATLLDEIARDFRDPDGYPLVSTCIIASTATISAKEEKEQAVRLVVKRWPSTGLGRVDHVAETGKSSRTEAQQEQRKFFHSHISSKAFILNYQIWATISSASWTPLHLAALLSSPTLVSFLLTQGYSPYVATHRGLTPLDLISDMESRRDVAALLESMMDDDDESNEDGHGGMSSQNSIKAKPLSPLADSDSRLDLLKFHRSMKSRRIALHNKRIKKREVEQAKDAWIMNKLGISGMGEGSEFLCWAFERERKRSSLMGRRGENVEEPDEEEESEDEEGEVQGGMGLDVRDATDFPSFRSPNTTKYDIQGDVNMSLPSTTTSSYNPDDIDDSTLLVFSSDTLPTKLRHLITNYPPQAFPLSRRTLPANSIYLLARYAAYRGGDDISAGANLAGLLEMVMLEVEKVCLANVESLPHLAFWLYNITMLLHLLQSDDTIKAICEEEDLGLMVEEMVNALQGTQTKLFLVHIIRLVETKLDTLIDPALLDHEPTDEPQVKFEDEWASTSFFRSLTSAASQKNKMRNPVPDVASVFDDSGLSGSPRSAKRAAPNGPVLPSSESSGRPQGSPSASKAGTLHRPRSIMDLRSSVTDSLRAALFNSVSPSNVTSILSSTLVVLQIYSVNPAFILQIFSQVFVWMAAETFNRIISSVSGKRYQCRSKAMQIRLNLEALAEWVRAQHILPDEIYRMQFRRVTQLLQVGFLLLSGVRLADSDVLHVLLSQQWLQCLSQITDVQDMASTLQHLPDLNPLQLQRAIRNYRFEVGESRISQDCSDYLGQLQHDWERGRVKTDIDRIHQEVRMRRSGRTIETADNIDSCVTVQDEGTTDAVDINIIFDTMTGLAQYRPAISPQSASEFDDSRFMLPLAVPHNRVLPAFIFDQTYHAMDEVDNSLSTFVDRPASLTGVPPRQSLQYGIRPPEELRRLPADFLDWLQASEAQDGDRVQYPYVYEPPRNRGLLQPSISSHSISLTTATPEKALPNGCFSNSRTEQSPVSPAFAHDALRMRNDATMPRTLERPIRLRQLSSGSTAGMAEELAMSTFAKHTLAASASSIRSLNQEASTAPDSPLRNKSSIGSNAFGSLTKQLWSRTQKSSDGSKDGYMDSSDDDDSYD
ncbi:hypothetical protein QFC19_003063 [Naganishia cerealis]|uniref:Uncharacterized protein n=1 Tax=Naganishia cerealis TaxID=610337 RepID=A0ACC2W7A6_9TREE|nr:hypothetical protein QFC19_003063 [Naganishia cerealis]